MQGPPRVYIFKNNITPAEVIKTTHRLSKTVCKARQMVPIENWGVGVGWGLELTGCSPQQSPIQQVDPFCKRVSQVPVFGIV